MLLMLVAVFGVQRNVFSRPVLIREAGLLGTVGVSLWLFVRLST
ncbi:hypothetical protein [Deinococcus sp.]|nr:hypothetical protein [Deinococcus sp.]